MDIRDDGLGFFKGMFLALLFDIAAIACVIGILALTGCGGKHWDCDKVRHQEVEYRTTADAVDATDYCMNDRMYDLCNAARYGSRACDWKR